MSTESKEKIDDQLIGSTIDDRFVVESLISKGGLSALYRGRDKTDDKPVTIRILLNQRGDDEQSIGRFKNAVKVMGNLRQENIVPLISSGLMESRAPYLVLPYIEGTSVREKVEREGPLSIEQALPIIRDVAAALEHAHEHGVIHRNLKPSNILLTQIDGRQRAVLTGFGIAKRAKGERSKSMVHTTKVVGSPLYMSPEQFVNSSLDARSDIYSLGCVIHQMLSGTPPFDAPSLVQLMSAHHHRYRDRISASKPELKVPEGIDDVLDAATLKMPANRYGSVKEMLSDLEAGKCSLDLRAAKASEPAMLQGQGVSSQEKIKRIALVTAGGLLVLALVVFVISFQSMEANRESAERNAKVPVAITAENADQPRYVRLRNLGDLLETGQYEAAIALLQKELKDPKNDVRSTARIYDAIGHVYMLSDKYDEAVDQYRQASLYHKRFVDGRPGQHRVEENRIDVDTALIALAKFQADPAAALEMVNTQFAGKSFHSFPQIYLTYHLAKWLDEHNRSEEANNLRKRIPQERFIDRTGSVRPLSKQDLVVYLTDEVRELQ